MAGPASKPPSQAKLLSARWWLRSLDEVSEDADGGGSSSDTLTGGHGGSGKAFAAASRRGRTAVTSLAGSLGGGSSGGAGRSAAGAARGGLSRVQGAAVRHDVGFAGLLVSGVAHVLGVAEVEELQADEGGHCLSVVLEAGSAAVGAADALVRESSLGKHVSIIVVVLLAGHCEYEGKNSHKSIRW